MYKLEKERQIELHGDYEVVVCGAGPAGIGAALSAAGQGLRTMLIETGGCLGGIWTSGMLSVILDVEGKGGIMNGIKSRLSTTGAILPRGNSNHNFVYDTEAVKLLLEDLCREAGVEVLLHTRVAAVIQEDARIQAVVTESSQGRMGISGKLFIDCTGNGELAAQAGCAYTVGHPATGSIQPASMLAIISGVPEPFQQMKSYEKKREFNEFLNSIGFVPSNKAPTIIQLPWAGLFVFSVNHQFDVQCDNIFDITKATLAARKEINTAIQALREKAGWSELRLVSTPAHIGLREGRRIQGLYNLSVQDIVSGQTFEDAVCTVKFPVDIHATEPGQTHGYGNQGVVSQPYHIPYRSLISADIANLGFAGRCISGDFFAHASYRVTANAVATGEAIGFAASKAIRLNHDFKAVPGALVAQEMRSRGYLI
jgi:hypothetical protein